MKTTIAIAALLALICTSADAKDNLRKNQEPTPMKGQEEEAFDSQDHRHLQVILNPNYCFDVCIGSLCSDPVVCNQLCSSFNLGACIKLCNGGQGSTPQGCGEVCSALTTGGCIAECNEGLGLTPEGCAAYCTGSP